MRYIIRVFILLFCFSCLLIAGQAGLKGPSQGVAAKVIDPSTIVNTVGPTNGRAFQTPLGYEISNGHNEELKITFPSKGTLGGTINYDENTGGSVPLAPNQGTNFQGMLQNGWIPYDAAMAVGPSHVLFMTNSQWAVYDKVTGAQLFITQFDPWFGNAAGGGFDPKCFYDATAGKWVIMCVEESNPNALIDISVSQTSNPLGAWWKYSFNVTLDGSTPTSNWMDFPGMGYDNNAIYVGGDMYSFANSYKYSKVRVFSKAQLYSGAAATWTDFVNLLNADGTSAFAPKPAQCVSASASEYIINTRPGGGSSVTLWRVDNAPSAPTLTRVATVSVGTYAVPPDAKQSGTGQLVATGDCRTQDAVYRNGFVFNGFSEKIGTNRNNSVAAVRYLKISSAGVKDKDITYTASGISMYYPAVCADASGNMFMTFSRSSSTQYASMYRTGMLTTDATIQASALVKAGVAANTSGRWGDYSAIAPDPSNSAAVWLYGGWANTSNRWATWVAAASFGVAPVTQPQVSTIEEVAHTFALNANYPNPFNPSTVISFSLPTESNTRLVVYNVIGQEVATLLNGMQTAGEHSVTFNASNLPSGIYYYKLDAAGISQIQKMVLAR